MKLPYCPAVSRSWGTAVIGAMTLAVAAPRPLCAESTAPSIARQWNETLLEAIRYDTPRPPVHARNLFHTSAAMYDAWAAFDPAATGQFVREKHTALDVQQARDEAIAYAAYRVLSQRYQWHAQPSVAQQLFDDLLASQGFDKNFTSTQGDSPAALGNRIAQRILDGTVGDGSYQLDNYQTDPTGYVSVNVPMLAKYPTATDQAGMPLADPNRWQQLYLESTQLPGGEVQGVHLQAYVAPHWGGVTPFAMQSAGGPYPWSDRDPGPPPQLGGVGDTEYRRQAVELIRMSHALDPTQGPGTALINISPSVNGNRSLGSNDSQGYAVNPVTGQPYADNFVRLGDYGRVLAEYWADGPRSETPPGHWNLIANAVSDALGTSLHVGGAGPAVDRLEWDVKMYLTLNGAAHDAAIGAWGVKREYDSARPITMIRHMARLGQSTDPQQPAYDPLGLPLEEGLIEVITADSIAPGGRHRHVYDHVNRGELGEFQLRFDEHDLVGKIALHAWAHTPADSDAEIGGTDWILGEFWMPYQLESFITPAFPGYVSGHSTYSRAAAQVLASFTGSPYFPGGLAEMTFGPDYLKFEAGPSDAMTLQWASYFDAADEAGLSRLWGGIHPEMDDLPGRLLGDWIGSNAFRLSTQRFSGVPEPTAGGLWACIVGASVAWRRPRRRRAWRAYGPGGRAKA